MASAVPVPEGHIVVGFALRVDACDLLALYQRFADILSRDTPRSALPKYPSIEACLQAIDDSILRLTPFANSSPASVRELNLTVGNTITNAINELQDVNDRLYSSVSHPYRRDSSRLMELEKEVRDLAAAALAEAAARRTA